jgi:hypothetical protein
MSEDALWRRTRAALGPYGLLVRVENPADPGTPDVCYLLRRRPAEEPVCGWLELKHMTTRPVRPTTPFRIDKLTLDQVTWHAWWSAAGGRVHTLLQVDRDVLLLTPLTIGRVFRGELTWPDVVDEALIVGAVTFPTAELVKALTSAGR